MDWQWTVGEMKCTECGWEDSEDVSFFKGKRVLCLDCAVLVLNAREDFLTDLRRETMALVRLVRDPKARENIVEFNAELLDSLEVLCEEKESRKATDMQRIVRIEIQHCRDCPHGHYDINVTRMECRKELSVTCYWLGSEEDNWHAFIPEWCPLWKAQGKPVSGVEGHGSDMKAVEVPLPSIGCERQDEKEAKR